MYLKRNTECAIGSYTRLPVFFPEEGMVIERQVSDLECLTVACDLQRQRQVRIPLCSVGARLVFHPVAFLQTSLGGVGVGFQVFDV